MQLYCSTFSPCQRVTLLLIGVFHQSDLELTGVVILGVPWLVNRTLGVQSTNDSNWPKIVLLVQVDPAKAQMVAGNAGQKVSPGEACQVEQDEQWSYVDNRSSS